MLERAQQPPRGGPVDAAAAGQLEHGRRRAAGGDRFEQHDGPVDRLDALHPIGCGSRHLGAVGH